MSNIFFPPGCNNNNVKVSTLDDLTHRGAVYKKWLGTRDIEIPEVHGPKSRLMAVGLVLKIRREGGHFRCIMSIYSFKSKKGKNVFLLSTVHSVSRRCETSGKPEIVLTYNKSKGGVDTMDQMAYAFTEKTKRWLLVVLFNIIDLSRVIRQARLSKNKMPHDDN
ncbi:PiggyBac transposable element-derived protein 4 [Plakobranchus ocellatus]|uniref:PiggyBac transposable element-derived protein 4 n=1 Tax=Plakobranchus ocellatus TaxID=259542 RepID=A0AAV3ZEQ7_9GAST|nr:PiggyBac transposable element-derived protein 4 [Plakobranchus ocellatus]